MKAQTVLILLGILPTSSNVIGKGAGKMARKAEDRDEIQDLLYQALETELGGVKVYETAISCALNEDLKSEWEDYLSETKEHVTALMTVMDELGMDPNKQTPTREVCAHLGQSLLKAMMMAKKSGSPAAAQIVAAECVVIAETKDRSNWELIGLIAEKSKGLLAKVLKRAYDEVAIDEDHHYFHTKGWLRELNIENLGFPAVLPPPEEVRNVESAFGAARAEKDREKMI